MSPVIIRVIALGILIAYPLSVKADQIFLEGAPKLDRAFQSMPSFSELAQELGPSVVNITVESRATEEEPEGQELIPGFPFKFKGGGEVSSLGSGFIINQDGLIVTNNHVIEKAGKVIVRLLDDKEEYVAEVVGFDQKTDLALLKIKVNRKLVPVFFGDSDSLNVGDWVLAIGNQFQLGQTVTAGIVSAKARRVPRGGPYDNFIQTDASINPGSSGGPLFNSKGQVVGINTAIFSPGKTQFGGTGFNIGIGFAVPINLSKKVISQLSESGKVTRGWLGVIIQPVTPNVARVLDLSAPYGALVSHVIPKSPAVKAGFEVGDVITKYGGHDVKENDDLPILVAETPIGQSVKIDFIRAKKAETVSAVIEKLDDKVEVDKIPVSAEEKFDDMGLILKDLTDDLSTLLQLPKGQGVLVNAVQQDSLAEKSGFVRGDIIDGIQLKGQSLVRVKEAAKFYDLLKEVKNNEPFLVLVRRMDNRSTEQSTTVYLTVSPG